jgi:hypothetical protein
MNASHYRIFQIPKKNGTREIAEPLPDLKQEQQDILKWLSERGIRLSKFAHGFARGRSIKTNASWHTGKTVVLQSGIDLKPSFSCPNHALNVHLQTFRPKPAKTGKSGNPTPLTPTN